MVSDPEDRAVRCVYLTNGASLSGFTLTSGLVDRGRHGGGVFCESLTAVVANCVLSGNEALDAGMGGGAYGGTLNNCIVYFNTAEASFDNYDSSSTLNYSCTTPLSINGVGNITNAPLFVDQASGNLRLQSTSPCINAGLNAFAPVGPDLDGNLRIDSNNGNCLEQEATEPTVDQKSRLLCFIKARSTHELESGFSVISITSC